uniref:protein-serine/threonine phosphatase n=1 Tax=Callorhinchus milii TaxID=7868 RepID=A0A4W3JEA2_CALMI
MINHLRSEDRIKLAVRLESTWANRIRYMVVVYTSGHQDTEENVLLGMDFSAKESNTCTIGMVLPLWSDTTIHLDGDGGFSVSTASRIHIFKPVSVQAMWSALQILHKSCEIARRYNYYPSGIALTWTSYYESCISSDQSCINEWNAMKDLQSTRPDSPALFVDKPTENELTERLIKTKLRCLMMSRDLENVTSKEIRNELEQQMTCNLKEYKGFIDNEMLTILGQMDKASLIFDHLYLGSEWNASNLEELQGAGVGYILNVTREIDNFFSGLFDYHNIRVFDEDTTDLLSFWNDTYNFITKAKKNHSKCLVHCKMGVSRSASTVIAYAMKEYGWSLERAYKYVKEKRSIAQPNTGFMKQLAEYEGILDASKQRHNSLWRRNSDGDLQETVRDGTGDPETPQTCGKQISEPPRRQGLAKDPTQAVNSNYYFRCLSDPSVDGSSYTEGPKESEPFSDCIDKGERDALRVDNVGFRYKGDGIPESRVIRSPQPWDTYEGEERMRSHQGISYQPFRAVEEPEENKNTLGLGVKHTEEDKALANGPSPGHASGTNESLANVQEASTNVENQLNKDNANNNNNAARICSKGDGVSTDTKGPSALRRLPTPLILIPR